MQCSSSLESRTPVLHLKFIEAFPCTVKTGHVHIKRALSTLVDSALLICTWGLALTYTSVHSRAFNLLPQRQCTQLRANKSTQQPVAAGDLAKSASSSSTSALSSTPKRKQN